MLTFQVNPKQKMMVDLRGYLCRKRFSLRTYALNRRKASRSRALEPKLP